MSCLLGLIRVSTKWNLLICLPQNLQRKKAAIDFWYTDPDSIRWRIDVVKVVDSVMSLFRVDFSGRGELADRQQKLNAMLSRLLKIAEEFNIAVYLTNQVYNTSSYRK